MAGRLGVPPDATAVAVNLTVTETAGSGYFTAYPAAEEQPPTSTVNVDREGPVFNGFKAGIQAVKK